jgi:cytochrome c biogenesis factor
MVSVSQCAKQAGQQISQDTTLALKSVVSMGSLSRGLLYFVISLVLSCCVVFFAMKKITFVSVFSVIILTIIFFILFTTMGSNVLSISLPFSAYPSPPHLGLDGVDPRNYLAGRNLQ